MTTREHGLLRRASMHRVGIGAVALLASWMAAQATAQAQDIAPSVRGFDGRTRAFSLSDLATTRASPIRLAECESASITFRFTGVDINRANLSFFEGQMCDDPTVRQDTTTTTCNELPPTAATMNLAVVDVAVPVRELLPSQCEAASGAGVQTVWVLALNARGDTVTGPGQRVSFPLAFDFAPPAMVGSLRATGGEDVATLTWSGGEAGTTYEVFLDPNGCVGSTPDSPGLMGEGAPDPTLLWKSGVSGGSTTVDFPDSVPFGGFVAVAIRASDRSGNVGSLSNIVCVERFETTSWWDSRCSGGDGGPVDELCRDDGGTCAASPGSSSGAGLGTLLMVALAALVIRRRAR